ncbi:MAG: hypothetical protein WEB67_09780 [Acidimicrobiia bacterium]
MPGSFGHLSARFIDYLTAKPLTDAERQIVTSTLTGEEARIFFEQGPKDQAHGFAAALVVLESGQSTGERLRAALLHDVGKRSAGLGVLGRVAASVLIKMGLPITGRFTLYRDHGPVGAADLEAAGSPPLVVEFARAHHGPRPDTLGEDDWALLQSADVPANARLARRRR